MDFGLWTGSDRGQASVEMAIALPLLLLLLFGAYKLGRVFYTYHTLHKSLRGGMEYALHAQGVNFCDPNDPVLIDAKNFIVFGNLQGTGNPVVTGLTVDMIQFLPERGDPASSVVIDCGCTGDGSCDISNGGAPPDYVTVNLPQGFPIDMTFPLLSFGTWNLRVSVRQPFLGG